MQTTGDTELLTSNISLFSVSVPRTVMRISCSWSVTQVAVAVRAQFSFFVYSSLLVTCHVRLKSFIICFLPDILLLLHCFFDQRDFSPFIGWCYLFGQSSLSPYFKSVGTFNIIPKPLPLCVHVDLSQQGFLEFRKYRSEPCKSLFRLWLYVTFVSSRKPEVINFTHQGFGTSRNSSTKSGRVFPNCR